MARHYIQEVWYNPNKPSYVMYDSKEGWEHVSFTEPALELMIKSKKTPERTRIKLRLALKMIKDGTEGDVVVPK